MRPVRRISRCGDLVPAAPDLAERGAYKVARAGDQDARAPDLGHGRRDEVAENEVDVDALRLQLRRQRRAPVLQEGLAARVGREVRRGGPTRERPEGKNEALSAARHAGRDDLRRLEGPEAVDRHDILELLAGRLGKGHGDRVALPHVVDQHAHVEVRDLLREGVVVLGAVLRVVHGHDARLQVLARELLLELRGEGLELGAGARDEDEVEAVAGELRREFLAEAVRGAGYDGPGAGLAILAELADEIQISH